MPEAMTLAQILLKLSVVLSPENAREIARQMEEHFPSGFLPIMSAGLEMTLLAMKHMEPECPQLFMGGAVGAGEEERSGLRDCVRERDTRQTMVARMEILQEIYPLRAAALYVRVLLNVLAGMFERNELASLNGEMMGLLIDGLQRAEAIIEARCVNCPKLAALPQ